MSGESAELATLEALARRLPAAPAGGEIWVGDDAAVVGWAAGPLLLAADTVVEGVHADLSLTGVDDLGWKAVAASVSDIAAMGGEVSHLLVTVVVPPGGDGVVERLYDGIEAAADALGAPVVGGDLTAGPALSVTVACTGTVAEGGLPPVPRAGARPGDALVVTGPLGAAAAGLRLLREGTPALDPAAVAAHRRPWPRLAEGRTARLAGAHAMIDLSDGLALDLRRLASASGVGAGLDGVPAVPAATREEAIGGGDDYELLVAAPDLARLEGAFAAAGLRAPVAIGRCTADAGELSLEGAPLPRAGWAHSW